MDQLRWTIQSRKRQHSNEIVVVAALEAVLCFLVIDPCLDTLASDIYLIHI